MKTYNVRVELDMMLSVDLEAENEQQAEEYAKEFVKIRLYGGNYCGTTVFEEANDETVSVFMTSYGMGVTDVEERDYT